MGFFGEEGRTEQLTTKTPEQLSQLSNFFNNPIQDSPLYGAGSNYLQGLLGNSPNAQAQFNAPYLQQFQQQVLPQISERFAGMGTGAGALNSSALGQQLGMAGSTLQNSLAQLREQMRANASGQALGYAQQPFSNQLGGIGQNTFENLYHPATPGIGQSLLKGLAGGAAGFALGGPPGAFLGATSAFGGAG